MTKLKNFEAAATAFNQNRVVYVNDEFSKMKRALGGGFSAIQTEVGVEFEIDEDAEFFVVD